MQSSRPRGDNLQIEQEDIPHLAQFFDSVELYLNAMKLNSGQQTDVRKQSSVAEGMNKCLTIWIERDTSAATYTALIGMLVKLNKLEITDKVLRYLASKN